MTLISSLSGFRGIVGDSLTPEVTTNIGLGYGQWIGSGTIIVGGDTRTSHHMVSSNIQSSLLSIGLDVLDIGFVPTPTVQQMIRKYNAAGGIVITASHNPVEWNGIKLMNSSGSFVEQADFDAIMAYINGPT